jgi:hypothetical protein
MATINYDDGAVKTIGTAGLTTASPGHGRSGPPVFGSSGRAEKIVTGSITFDSSYPSGGEDISDIFDLFRSTVGVTIIVDQSAVMVSAGTGKRTRVDYTNKKLMLYDNAVASAEVANASDQSGAAGLRFIARGPA